VQLGQLQKIEAQLLDLGFQIVAVSPDPPDKLSASVEENPLTYSLFSDSEFVAARAFGVAFQAASGNPPRLLPVPAVFLIRSDGSIGFTYANPNYEVRLQPEILLAAARTERGQQ
jgi:peroxiredoxin